VPGLLVGDSWLMGHNTNMFRPIPSDEVASMWTELRPRLLRAMKYAHGEYDITDIYEAITRQRMHLWALEDIKGDLHSLCVTELIDYERIKSCCVVIAEGKIDPRWGPAIEYLGRWARRMGCSRLEAIGRFGWVKKANMYGFKLLNVKLAKQL
jgi:hypothetical protein